MYYDEKISDKLQRQIDEYNAKPFEAGEFIQIEGRYLKHNNSQSETALNTCKIKEVNGDKVIVYNGYHDGDTCEVDIVNCHKDSIRVGYNPFPEKSWKENIDFVNYPLSSILLLTIKDKDRYMMDTPNGKVQLKIVNWNPYVIDKEGKKQYYQRDFCWTLNDKQNLIESIYNGIGCGTIIVRERPWTYLDKEYGKGNTEVGLYDVVDGKQRLHTLFEFINDMFPDSNGNYYSDFSVLAKRKFDNTHPFTFGKMGKNTKDVDVLKAFLGVNFSGVEMSKEHIDYVKHLNEIM